MHSSVDLSTLRGAEFARLDATRSIYLDYTGAALYPASLITRDAERLTNTILGNPHSENAPSRASTGTADTARRLTLQFLDADPDVYDVVFTANASAAIRILAEAFPFRSGSRLVMTADNHNSVNGLHLEARRRRAHIDYIGLEPDLRSPDPAPWLADTGGAPSLFAYPAQSNFSGVRHPLRWVRDAQQRGYKVLLDAAGYTPTSPLSLTDAPADFVAISFYKMFGYPTGIGALVARRAALTMLRRRYFGGGTVQFASVQNRVVRLRSGGEGFEDGTPNFLAMPAVCDGLNWLQGIGMENIQHHVDALTEDFLQCASLLGDRMVIYGPRNTVERGGTIAFNLCRAGRLLPFEHVEAAARDHGIAIRGGCFCNPGAAEAALEIPADRARKCLRHEFSVPRFRTCLGDRPVGAVRASIGIATTQSDIAALFKFIGSMTQRGGRPLPEPCSSALQQESLLSDGMQQRQLSAER